MVCFFLFHGAATTRSAGPHFLPASLGMGGWGSDVKYAQPAAKLGPKLSGPSETLYNIHVTTILENQTITSKLTVLIAYSCKNSFL